MVFMRFFRIAVAMLLALVSTNGLAQERPGGKNIKAVRFGQLWDATGKVWTNAIVIVNGGKIRCVTTDASTMPAGVETIDLFKYIGLPGLIDVQTHLTMYAEEDRGLPMLKQISDTTPAMEVFLARKGAMRTLEAGVTTVRDLSAEGYMDIAMRDLINSGEMIGPRMFVSGYGLYATQTPSKKQPAIPGAAFADVGPEALLAVRQQLAAGTDLIKMYASTGTDDDVTGFQTYTFEEIKAAVSMAHQFGKKIAIHSYGPDGARDAVRAGTDSLEHATDMDDATIQEMAKRGTFYVPTIDHNRYYIDNWQKIGYANGFLEKSKAFIERNLETARKAHKAGVKFAMGSDAIYTMYGQNTRELGWFVKAGMTPEQALRTATTNAAELLGKEKELDAVAPGDFAALVAAQGEQMPGIDVALDKWEGRLKSAAVVADKVQAQPRESFLSFLSAAPRT